MQIKRKRRSTSSIVFLIFVILLVAGGIILLAYPFITGIPTIIQRGGNIAVWQSLKDKGSVNQSTATSMTATSEIIINTIDEVLLLFLFICIS